MEKKSIGSFIAALRKASGLTQRELAEKLNVSDKAVSRWEREESLPDLSLIPAIAEIFGVTADELLRGERMKEGESLPRTEEKSEKQLKNLINRSLLRFNNRSIIAAGVGLAGLIGAMVANIGFNKAYVAFFIALAFCLAAALCETGFTVAAMAALNVEEGGAAVQVARHKILNRALLVFGLIIVLFAATLPLIIFPYNAYMGLSGDGWLEQGAVFGAFGLLASMFAAWLSVGIAVRRGLFSLDAKQRARRRLRVISVLATLGIMGLTLVANILLTENTTMYADTIVFDNYEDFTAYMMRKDEVGAQYGASVFVPGSTIVTTDMFGNVIATQTQEGGITYYDEDGNPTTEVKSRMQEIVNNQGETVLRYYRRNDNAAIIRYEVSDTCLPITVITQEALNSAHATVRVLDAVFAVVYVLELIAAVAIYIIKSRRIEKRTA